MFYGAGRGDRGLPLPPWGRGRRGLVTKPQPNLNQKYGDVLREMWYNKTGEGVEGRSEAPPYTQGRGASPPRCPVPSLEQWVG